MPGKIFVDWEALNALREARKQGLSAVDFEEPLPKQNTGDEAVEGIRGALQIRVKPERTFVHLLVIDTHNSLNHSISIPCSRGHSMSGYARVKDVANDAYLMDGVEYLSLGQIPISCEISLPNTGAWSVEAPLPDHLVERMLSSFHRRQAKAMKAKYPKPRFEIHYVQMLGCH